MPKKTPIAPYENNPFFIAVNGMTLLFNSARGIAIIFFALSVISFYSGNWSPNTSSSSWSNELMATTRGWAIEEWALAVISVLIIGLAIAMVSALFGGAASYTSAQIAQGKSVSVREAFREAFENLWSYLWLQIIIFVKLFLWTLLFVIPGVYMAVRYSLAGVAFYDNRKKLRGNAAIKESLRLTRGAWITTFASIVLFNSLTLSIISNVVTPSINAVLYRQFSEADKKPAAHWLSILTLGVIIALTVIFVPLAIF